jgi:hypothetical protein
LRFENEDDDEDDDDFRRRIGKRSVKKRNNPCG